MEGVDFWYWCLRMAYIMPIYAAKTHTTRLHSHCLLALRSWEAHWGFDALSEIHIQVNPTDWAQVSQESKQVGQVSLHLSPQDQACANEMMGDVAHIGCPRRPGHDSIGVCSVAVSWSILTSEGRNTRACDPTQTGACTARSLSQL